MVLSLMRSERTMKENDWRLQTILISWMRTGDALLFVETSDSGASFWQKRSMGTTWETVRDINHKYIVVGGII